MGKDAYGERTHTERENTQRGDYIGKELHGERTTWRED